MNPAALYAVTLLEPMPIWLNKDKSGIEEAIMAYPIGLNKLLEAIEKESKQLDEEDKSEKA